MPDDVRGSISDPNTPEYDLNSAYYDSTADPTSRNYISRLDAGMDWLADQAAAGGFTIDPTGGEALLAAIRKLSYWADRNAMRLDRIAQEPPLGGTAAADVMKPYVRDVAADDGQGFIAKFKELQASLLKAEKAINDAMLNYQTIGEEHARKLRLK